MRAADDPADPLRLITLCTVSPEGKPSARLMLLRGADRDSGRIWCHSRRETGKIADLRSNPAFTAVIYDAADAIQIRLSGTARLHELDDEATGHFDQLILAKQSQHSVAGSKPDPIWPGESESLIRLSKLASRKHFVVIEMTVESIDWTQVVQDQAVHVLLEACSHWQPKLLT
jgi:hypothetical protein